MSKSPSDKPVKAPNSSPLADHVRKDSRPISSSEKVTSISTSSSVFIGPLPPPDILAAYEDAIPGLGGKIVDTFQQQVTHRINMEQERNRADIHIDHVAPKYALSAVAMSLVSVTTICIYGHPWAAAIVGGLEIGGIIGLFLRGSRKHKQLEGRTDKPTQ